MSCVSEGHLAGWCVLSHVDTAFQLFQTPFQSEREAPHLSFRLIQETVQQLLNVPEGVLSQVVGLPGLPAPAAFQLLRLFPWNRLLPRRETGLRKCSASRSRKVQLCTVCVAASTPSPRSLLPSEASRGGSTGASSGAPVIRAPPSAS